MKRFRFIISAIFACLFLVGYSQSVSDYFSGAAKGDAEAMYNLGMCYLRGNGVPRDKRVATQWFEKSANKGNTKAMTRLGIICNDDNRISEAIQWHEKATKKGDSDTPFYLAIRYDFDGDGNNAFKYYKLASERGCVPAMSRYAWCYYENRGVLDRNHYAIAADLAKKAADLGNTEAMYLLYRIYDNRKSGLYNSTTSREWLEKAANSNNARACYELAYILEEEGDYAKAYDYYCRCENACVDFVDKTIYFHQYGSTHYPADALTRQQALECDYKDLIEKYQEKK